MTEVSTVGADVLNDWLRQFRWVYHFTGISGWNGIANDGVITNRDTPVGGPVWVTPLAYPTAAMAEDLLALCGEPIVGYYAVRLNQLIVGIIKPAASKTCPNGTYRNGGGPEQVTPSPVNATPIRRFPVVPSF